MPLPEYTTETSLAVRRQAPCKICPRILESDFCVRNHGATKGVHLQRFINRNDQVFGSPWATGLGTLESPAKSLFRG